MPQVEKTDRAGRLPVNDDCTLPGHPEVFAIGDMVSLQGPRGVAQPAIHRCTYVVRVIRARLDGEHDLEPFRWNKGPMATIGCTAASRNRWACASPAHRVPDVGLHPSADLVGWGNRLAAMYAWLRSLVFSRNGAQRIINLDQVKTEIPEAREPLP